MDIKEQVAIIDYAIDNGFSAPFIQGREVILQNTDEGKTEAIIECKDHAGARFLRDYLEAKSKLAFMKVRNGKTLEEIRAADGRIKYLDERAISPVDAGEYYGDAADIAGQIVGLIEGIKEEGMTERAAYIEALRDFLDNSGYKGYIPQESKATETRQLNVAEYFTIGLEKWAAAGHDKDTALAAVLNNYLVNHGINVDKIFKKAREDNDK